MPPEITGRLASVLRYALSPLPEEMFSLVVSLPTSVPFEEFPAPGAGCTVLFAGRRFHVYAGHPDSEGDMLWVEADDTLGFTTCLRLHVPTDPSLDLFEILVYHHCREAGLVEPEALSAALESPFLPEHHREVALRLLEDGMSWPDANAAAAFLPGRLISAFVRGRARTPSRTVPARPPGG